MRERDRGSFEEWARARQQQLVRRAYLVTGDHHRAEDLVQEALVGVAMRWDTLRDGNPDAWVRTVVYRANVSWWRRHRREVSVDRVPDHVGSPGPGPARLAIEDALLGVQADGVVNGGRDVGRAVRLRYWVGRLFVALPDDLADTDAGAGEEN